MSDVRRAVFRLPWVALIFPVLLFVMVTPLAAYKPDNGTYNPFLLALYVIPVLGVAYVAVTSTLVTSTELVARTLLGRRRISWAELDGFEFRGSRWALAVSTSGTRTRLPMVRPRDLPRLAAVSGGRLNLSPAVPPSAATGERPQAGIGSGE